MKIQSLQGGAHSTGFKLFNRTEPGEKRCGMGTNGSRGAPMSNT